MSQDGGSLQATDLTWPREAQLCFSLCPQYLIKEEVMGGSQPKGEEQGIPRSAGFVGAGLQREQPLKRKADVVCFVNPCSRSLEMGAGIS